MPTGVYTRIKPPWNKGKKIPWVKNKITSFKKGHIPWNKGIKSYVKPWLNKKRPEMSGDKHPCWKGGISKPNEKIRKSLEYKIWRRTVFERDNYTCVFCKIRSKKGVIAFLHADHIKPFAYFPELRFAIDNGRTLCSPCHKKTNTYGEKAKKLYSEIKDIIKQ